MKPIQMAFAALLLTTGNTWAVGVMGALFRGCWQSIALEKALVSECEKSQDSALCYTAREVVADDLQTLIKFCKSLPQMPQAQAALKRAQHDLDLVKKPSAVYHFELSLEGGPQWSSGDSVASSPTPPARSVASNDESRMITERVNTFFKRYQTPEYATVERRLREEYLTQRFQRERARQDTHREEIDSDPYTKAESAPWDVGLVRVKAVELQGSHAEVSVTRGDVDYGMKISVIKEDGAWGIDRVYFARK